MQFGLVLSAQRPDCVLIGNARQEKTRTKAFRGPWFLIGSQRLSHASA